MAECPLPSSAADAVLLGHGSGGRMTAQLLRDLFLPALGNPVLDRLGDSAVFDAAGLRLAFTTDAFVVSPLRFPGGDLGSLAVHGTINDLAVSGARPLALSAAFILEEGYPLAELRGLIASMRAAAHAAEVQVVAADTKVVERGKGDGVYVTTSGIGVVPSGVDLAPERVQPGDALLVSGPVGDHGIAVLSAREGLAFDTDVVSDSAALHHLAGALLTSGAAVRCMRDPTRGGVATVVNELAVAAGVSITVEEAAVPVRSGVRGACEMLGLDPLYVACEGRLLAIVAAGDADRALDALRAHPLGTGAARIGEVAAAADGPPARLRTPFGSIRTLDVLPGAQLPRIC
ncbi:MAG TPA: hydrogenase expression/formation protein HypE [Candidatus Dormibacteraeota bacterium]|nr:hydrogenase expression/formation protein HypE [Candidatus Dormibacteraeota bacterium]